MLRIALVLLIFATGFVMLTGDTTISHLVEEKLVWAALLPGGTCLVGQTRPIDW